MIVHSQGPRLIIILAMALSLMVSLSHTANAQSYSQYCQDRAQRLSGYRHGNDILGGAVRGAVGGAVLGSIFGSTRKDRERGAAIGAVIGGMKSASRPNSKAARIYRLEYENCMRRR